MKTKFICIECGTELYVERHTVMANDEISIIVGVTPCKYCNAQHSVHPTSENLRNKLSLLTSEQLSALEILLPPLTCG